jgi:hypothetical protein
MFDMKFMDYRARRDFNKIRGYPTLLQSTDMNITRMQGKMKQMEETQTQARAFIVLYFLVENFNEPSILAGFVGLVFSWWMYTNKKSE